VLYSRTRSKSHTKSEPVNLETGRGHNCSLQSSFRGDSGEKETEGRTIRRKIRGFGRPVGRSCDTISDMERKTLLSGRARHHHYMIYLCMAGWGAGCTENPSQC
jgi:hypothetical protein